MVRFVALAFLLSNGLLAANSESQAVHHPPDTTLGSDPETWELIPALPAPGVTTQPTVGTTRLTEQSIIALARADARRHRGLALVGGRWPAGTFDDDDRWRIRIFYY